jgi:hypothetical protein
MVSNVSMPVHHHWMANVNNVLDENRHHWLKLEVNSLFFALSVSEMNLT